MYLGAYSSAYHLVREAHDKSGDISTVYVTDLGGQHRQGGKGKIGNDPSVHASERRSPFFASFSALPSPNNVPLSVKTPPRADRQRPPCREGRERRENEEHRLGNSRCGSVYPCTHVSPSTCLLSTSFLCRESVWRSMLSGSSK